MSLCSPVHGLPTKTPQSALQSIVFVGSYAPRQCGIATFTRDLRHSVAPLFGSDSTPVVAVEDVSGAYDYPDEVRFALPQHDRLAYRQLADLLNVEQFDVAVVQHEYGIYGGPDGAMVIDLMARLHMPTITTLHTILTKPSIGQREALMEISRHSARVVVMSEKARTILRENYAIEDEKIAYIPHGIPELPFVDPHYYSDELKTCGRRVMLTFGLLGPGKGIENVIRAIPEIVRNHPDLLYIILGATHPHVRKQDGERYRESLVSLAQELGVSKHVRFEDRYVDQDELAKYLGLADLYVIPYPNAAQITSGTLAYAAGAGNAIVSTPFWHAEELLSEGRGELVPFNDVKAMSKAIVGLLSDNNVRHAMRRAAYLHTRSMTWPQIGQAYAQLAGEVFREQHRGDCIGVDQPLAVSISPAMDDLPTLEHLDRLTDDTGLLQHARFAIPDRDHGYCIDDNARALATALAYHQLLGDERALTLADRYLAFVNHAFNRANGRFRNFMSYDRRWLEDQGSEDSHGRAVWALGETMLSATSDGTRYCAYRLFKDSLPVVETFSSPRAWAFAVVGMDRYLRRITIDAQVQRTMHRLADRLEAFATGFIDQSDPNAWTWPEPELTYDNARIPQAMILAGARLDRKGLRDIGTRLLHWLSNLQTNPTGAVSLVGNRGWATREGRAIFDQQPLEAAAFVEAAADAYRITGDETWFDMAKRFYLWFYGHNDLALPLRDPSTHGCGDGLHAGGVNFNQGAESTLALLSSSLVIRNLYRNAISESEVATVA